jgi:hypothetical protein
MNEERTSQERNRLSLPFHPVLFAVAPILFVYAHNGVRIPIDPRELVLPIVLSLAVTALLWTIAGLLLRSATRAALVVSIFLMLFFTYGHIAGTFMPDIYASSELLLGWAVLMGVGIWLAARRGRRTVRGPLFGVTVMLNCFAFGILAVVFMSGTKAFAHRPPRAHRASGRDVAATDPNYPDIYYIITDSYVRSDVLKSRYNTDNSAFIGELERLGFFVADRARSNYAWTHPSLASSLNFTYLDSLAEAIGPESDNGGPLLGMIQNSRLVDFLRRRGYEIVSFASGDVATDLPGSDVRFAPPWSLTEFQGILVNTTLLRDALLLLLHKSSFDRHRDRVLYTLRNLPNAGLGRHPVFVFAHIISPHRPYVLGTSVRRPGAPNRSSLYGDQVTHLSTLLVDVVWRILGQSPRPPIIVIQADHGLREVVAWDDSARSQLQERHAILYAVYLPPSGKRNAPSVRLYDSISPVNTFRVILSQYFETTMAVLPDRSYFSLLSRPYLFHDVDRPDSCPVIGGPAKPTGRP